MLRLTLLMILQSSLVLVSAYADVQQQFTKTPIVCYFSWHGPQQDMTPDKIELGFCTHIIAGFASVTSDGLVDPGKKSSIFKQVSELKRRQPELKVLLSIGEGGGASGFTTAVNTPENRRKFIESILDLLGECDMDGVDIDWEFPGWNTPYTDKNNLALFLQDFREAVANTSILLSVAVAGKLPIIAASYDVLALSKYVDFINLMTYGFHDYKEFEDPYTGFNSPLFPRAKEKWYFATLNMEWAANYWVELGMPRSKIMVGVPTYAHTYVLANASENGVDAFAVDGGQDWSYSQVCSFIETGATTVYDSESRVPYAYKDLQWISFENEQSIREKVNWIKSQNFGGVMTFNLNCDDWQKSCGEETFPLHKLIHSILNENYRSAATRSIGVELFLAHVLWFLVVYCIQTKQI